MAHEKLIAARTDLTNLVSNLRGEVGEVITTWLIMRRFVVSARRLQSGDLAADASNREVRFGHLMADKLADELVGRLSELAEEKVGQLTFHFAARKIKQLEAEANAFRDFIVASKIREKRNRDVAHKQLPEQWHQKKAIHVGYRVLLRGVALALRLMKRIDRVVLGPSAPFLWREARKRRYDFLSPPCASYMLVPYLGLAAEQRIEIVRQELEEGRKVLTEMPTSIEGRPAKILAAKEWGVILLRGRALALDRYPLQKLESISFGGDEHDKAPSGFQGPAAEATTGT
jgi:hypothetical protein